jgi:DNA-binding beta-propeller fold protein YncE
MATLCQKNILGNIMCLHVHKFAALLLFFLLISASPSHAMTFEHVMDIGTRGAAPGQFKYVEDFAFSIDGHLLATDAAHAYVQVFEKTTGKFISRFGGKGDEDANLEKPKGISVDKGGRIFVADYTAGEIKIYDKNYRWLDTFSEYGYKPGQTIKTEFSDIFDGKYYVSEEGNHRISVFDLQGKYLFAIGKRGSKPGQLNNPDAAKFNSEGKLFVADLRNNRIQVFDKSGKFLFGWGSTGRKQGEFRAPSGIGIDKHDNLYVGEIGNDRIQIFDKNGKFITGLGQLGNTKSEFDNVHGVIVDKKTGWVYIADTGNSRIRVYKPVD